MEQIRTNEDLNDESYYTDADLTSHLRDKIRLQASRLRSLEHYRLLCERRIQELQPTHPLPIKSEHLGMTTQSQELELALKKISRLESQLSQQLLTPLDSKIQIDYDNLLERYNELLRDKGELEESLRAEMLNCEEQRMEIELLKQTIEGSIEEIKDSKYKGKTEESRRENKMKSSILDFECQIKRLYNQLRNRESENEGLVKEREEMDMHLRQAAEALQIAEEEVSKLELEKAKLTEFIEKLTVKENEYNELHEYFLEMKKDFHETLKELEGYKIVLGKKDNEGKFYKEEIEKVMLAGNGLQKEVEGLKKNIADKEIEINLVKDEKIQLEGETEKLKSKIKALNEALKETQENAVILQNHIDSISKQDPLKTEAVIRLKSDCSSLYQENLLYAEQFSLIRQELESAKRAKTELERQKELDINQLSEYKALVSELQNKCENFEGLKRSRNELEMLRKTDLQRISQLKSELDYLQGSINEYQHRESMQTQTLSESKLISAKLSAELEEIYQENNRLLNELNQKTKESELYLSKFNHLNEYCQTLEADKAELSQSLQNEKGSVRVLKEQAGNEKNKAEELQKSLSEMVKAKEKTETDAGEKAEEAKTMRSQWRAAERELKDKNNELEKNQMEISKLTSELRELRNLLERKDYELERTNSEISKTCRLISAFCGKATISYNDYRSCLSDRYKLYLDSWKESSGSSIDTLNSWAQNTIDELKELSNSLFQSNKQLKITTSDFSRLQKAMEETSSGENFYKQHAAKLKHELEDLYQQNDMILEKSEEEIQLLRYELNSLKHELMSLTSEKYSLSETLKSVINENQSLKMNSDILRQSNRSSESIGNERVSYSKEMMIRQAQRDLGVGEVKEIKSTVDEPDREKIRKNMICMQDHNPHTCPYLHQKYVDKVLSTKPQFS